MKFSTLRLVVSCLSFAVLSACGGGGSSTPVTPTKPDVPVVVTTCTNGATDFPTCTFFAAKLQTTVPAPAISPDSPEFKGWSFLNDLRANLGLGKFTYSIELAKAAKSHADYLNTNQVFAHTEDSTKAGFTGEWPIDRVIKTGYVKSKSDALTSEVIATGNDVTGAIQQLLRSVYHRGVLLNQSWRDIGFGTTCYACLPGDGVSLVANPAFKMLDGAQRNASDFILMYPYSGQTNVSLQMCGESPWPFPVSEVKSEEACTIDANGKVTKKVGMPISFAVEANLNLTVSSFTTWEDGGAPLAAWLNTSATDNLVGKNEAYLTAKGSLKPNTKYWAKFQGSANGKVIVKEWSFTTGN